MVKFFKNGKIQTVYNNTGVTKCNHVGMIPLKMMLDVNENCAILKVSKINLTTNVNEISIFVTF